MKPRDVTDATTIRTRRQALRVFFSRQGPRLLARSRRPASWAARFALGATGSPRCARRGGRDRRVAVPGVAGAQVHPALEPRTIAGKPFDPSFARAHRTHHADPREVDVTLLPMQVIRASIPGAAGLWLLVFGPRRAAITAMATYSTMAVFYEWTHFIVHTNVKPLTSYGKKVRRNTCSTTSGTRTTGSGSRSPRRSLVRHRSGSVDDRALADGEESVRAGRRVVSSECGLHRQGACAQVNFAFAPWSPPFPTSRWSMPPAEWPIIR